MFAKNKCKNCSSKLKEDFDYCPYCGTSVQASEEDYGLLGKYDQQGMPLTGGGSFGITDKMIASLMNSIMKSFERQMGSAEFDTQNIPNGITIKMSNNKPPQKKGRLPGVTQEAMQRMRGLPRVDAKSSVRRIGDKVVYELKAPGVQSVNDVFVAKLASGYEVKAIGKNKVYVSSLPVELPLKSYSVEKEGLTLEFGSQ